MSSIIKGTGPIFVSSFLLEHLGSWFCGLLLVECLSGIVFCQLCIYLSRFGFTDHRWTKGLVICVMLLSVLDDLKIFAMGVETFCAHFGDFAGAIEVGWLQRSESIIVGSLVTPVQTFFYIRCLKNLQGWHRWAFSLVVVPLLPLTLGWGIVVAAKLPSSFFFLEDIRPYAIAWGACSAICDVIISSTLILHLWQQSKKSLFPETQSILLALVRMTLLSQVPVTVASILSLVLYLEVKGSTLFLVALAAEGKLACISMFYVLNRRSELRKLHPTTFTMPSLNDQELGSSSICLSPTRSDNGLSICKPLPAFTRETYTHVDEGGEFERAILSATS